MGRRRRCARVAPSRGMADRPSRRVLLVVPLLLLTACTGGAPDRGDKTDISAPASRAAPSPTPALTQEANECTPARQRFLVEQFFGSYNRRDLAEVLALFDFEQRSLDYFDNVEGQTVVDIHNRAALEQHLRARFALGDQFTVTNLGINEHPTPGMGNPTVAFTRVTPDGTYLGNAKLVCTLGQLRAVIMTSRPTARQ